MLPAGYIGYIDNIYTALLHVYILYQVYYIMSIIKCCPPMSCLITCSSSGAVPHHTSPANLTNYKVSSHGLTLYSTGGWSLLLVLVNLIRLGNYRSPINQIRVIFTRRCLSPHQLQRRLSRPHNIQYVKLY